MLYKKINIKINQFFFYINLLKYRKGISINYMIKLKIHTKYIQNYIKLYKMIKIYNKLYKKYQNIQNI